VVCRASSQVHLSRSVETLPLLLLLRLFLYSIIRRALSSTHTRKLQGRATFGNVRVKIASQESRLLFVHVQTNVPTGIRIESDVFTTAPGTVRKMRYEVDPGVQSGCARCEGGVHLAGERLPVKVILLDAFENRISFCFTALSCDYLPDATIAVQLISPPTLLHASRLLGQVTDKANEGIVSFRDLRVQEVGEGYVLRACIIAAEDFVHPDLTINLGQALCAAGGNHLKMLIDSKPFTVVSTRPKILNVLQISLESGEFQQIPVQPLVSVMDEFGNKVVTDCYRGASELATCPFSICNASGLATCPVQIDVVLLTQQGKPIPVSTPQAKLHGATSVHERQGIASFTDLALIPDTSEWPGTITKCQCTKDACSQCLDCNIPPPFPHYRLSFRAVDGSGSVLALAEKNIDLKKRAQKMQIIVQPALIVAQEIFASSIVVEVLDCSDSVAIYDVATVSASIAYNAGGGTISGMVFALVFAP